MVSDSIEVHTRLMFLNVIVRLVHFLGRGTGTKNRMARWSETARSVHCRWEGVMPAQHTRSSVCPLSCVRPCTCCVKLKQSSSESKSVAREQLLEST